MAAHHQLFGGKPGGWRKGALLLIMALFLPATVIAGQRGDNRK